MSRRHILFAGIAAAGAIAGVGACYRRDIRAVRSRLERLNTQIVQTGSGPIEYVRSGDGYPLLVVHGALGGVDQGVWLAERIGPRRSQINCEILSVSRFGHLRSPVPPGATLDAQADAYASLLDGIGIRRAAVLAISGGATSAIRFAARYPERISALILLCPDAPPGMSVPPRFIFDRVLRNDFVYWAAITFFGRMVQHASGLVPKGVVLSPEDREFVKQMLERNMPISERIDGFVFETYTTASEFEASVGPTTPYPLNKLETPVLVINALDDHFANPEHVRRLASQMPNARLYTLRDGGHFFFGHRDEVRAEITQFLRTRVVELERHSLAEARAGGVE